MDKIFPRVLLTFMSFLIFSSCTQDLINPPTLSVSSADTIESSDVEEEHTIPINTNQENWQAICNADWIKIRELGNNLVINISQNTAPKERTSKIVIIAGNQRAEIAVKQKGNSKKFIETTPAELVLNRKSDKVHVQVKSHSDEWIAEVPNNVNWLSIHSRPKYGELIISVTTNDKNMARECDITLSNGDATKQLHIRQEGKPYFILPFMNWGKDLIDINALEIRRGSQLVSRPAPGNPMLGIRPIKDYSYSTLSAAFPIIKYECLNSGNRFMYKATLVSPDMTISQDPNLFKFIEEQGYTRNEDEAKGLRDLMFFENKEKSVKMALFVSRKESIVTLTFYPMVAQSKDYKIPNDLTFGFPFKSESTMYDVDEWERKNGGEYDQQLTDLFGRRFYHFPSPHYAHIYTSKDPNGIKLSTMTVLLDPEYTYYYKFGAIKYITKEFDQVLQNLGYTYLLYDYENQSAYYRSKDFTLEIGNIIISGVEFPRCKLTPLRK